MTARVVLCAIMKSEAPYLLEWVAYHRLLGFDIIVADNGGADGTSEILQRLDGAGVIRRVDFTWATKTPQLSAYRAMMRYAHGLGYEIAGFIDTDEFFSRTSPPLDACSTAGADYIAGEFDRLGASQLSYHWLSYGSRETPPRASDLVLERFSFHSSTRAPTEHQHVKSFVRLKSLVGRLRNALLLGVPVVTPHHFRATRKWYVDGTMANQVPALPTYGTGMILHYRTKSEAEFIQRRSLGEATNSAKPYDSAVFKALDYADEYSPVPANVVAEISAEHQRLQKLCSMSAPSTSLDARRAKWLSIGISMRARWRRRYVGLVDRIAGDKRQMPH